MTIIKGGNGKKNGEKKEEQTVDYVEKGSDGTVASKFYGIKSYLHNFYDRGSKAGTPEAEEFYLLSEGPKKKVFHTCRAALFIGMALLICGAIIIIAAHLYPTYEGRVHANLPATFEFTTIDVWKMTGLIVFAFGGLTIAISLLIPLCCKMRWDRETAYDQIGEPIRIFDQPPPAYPSSYGSGSPTKQIPTPGGAQPTLPVTEQVQRVQPESDAPLRKLSDEDLLLAP